MFSTFRRSLSSHHHHHHRRRRLHFHRIDPESLDSILRRCPAPRQTKQIHAQLISSHFPSSPFLFSHLISLYSRFGLLSDAQSAFESVPISARISLLYNSILRANLSHSRHRQVISIYLDMDLAPDGFTFPLVIKECNHLADRKVCELIHAHVFVMGFNARLHVGNELVSMYSNLGRMEIAQKVFDGMSVRTVASWNMLVSGYMVNFDCKGALCVFRRMEGGGQVPNSVTWTCLLSAHARCHQHEEVVELFDEMRSGGVEGSAESVAVALSVCPYLERGGLTTGKKIHGYAVTNGFEGYLFVRNSLVCMYGKLGCREDAWVMFSGTEEKSLISWNALISSYAFAGLCDELVRSSGSWRDRIP